MYGHACLHVCMYVCVYVCMHAYIHNDGGNQKSCLINFAFFKDDKMWDLPRDCQRKITGSLIKFACSMFTHELDTFKSHFISYNFHVCVHECLFIYGSTYRISRCGVMYRKNTEIVQTVTIVQTICSIYGLFGLCQSPLVTEECFS